MNLPPLRLKKNEDRRLRAGHLWVFSNEVDVTRTPLTAFQPGDPAVIQSSAGRPLAYAYVNPKALICARIISRDPAERLDRSLLEARMRQALDLRQRLYERPFYRLVFGEGDRLPGLVVDRYGDVLVVQITTAGMERSKDAILDALRAVVEPRALLLRNDTPVRALEGLPSYVEPVGEVPERVELEEHGARFSVPLTGGQKTGWFYDQRANRRRMLSYVRGWRVLDAFSYVGAWGIEAALAGAREVMCVDSSEAALEEVRRNAAANGVQDRVAAVRGDALEMLASLGPEFDAVLLDPPALIKRKKDIPEGEQAYLRLNRAAMSVLAPGGLLVTSSCSYHLPADRLQWVVLKASRALGRDIQILEQGAQGPDHPVHPAIAETRYVKTLFARPLS